MGRKSTFTQKVADEICQRLSTGETLADICRSENMPAYRTVYDWQEANEKFAAQFARARDIGFDAIAESCLDIADDGSNDYVTKKNADGTEYEAVDHEHIQRSKLRVDTRLKLLAKWSPKRYGERVEHGGAVETKHTMSEEMKAWLDQR